MRSVSGALISLIALVLGVQGAFAQWEPVASGFDYQEFNLAGPVEAFVVRMAVGTGSSTEAIDSMIAQGQYYKVGLPTGGRETVSGMAARYDDTISFYWQEWGRRNDVVAAINGDYWESDGGGFTGRPQSGQVQGGWFCRRFGEFSGGSGFFQYILGVPRLGGDVRNGATSHARQTVHFADDSTANLTGVNIERGSDDLILYTPQWAGSTHTDSSGVEVLARVNRPALPLPHGTAAYSCTGTILEVRSAQGDTPVPFDCIVLSGTGANATTLLNKCIVGQTVRLRMIVRDYGFASRTPVHPPQDWTKAYGGVGVDRELVIDSTVTNLPSPAWPRDPRTAVAFNSNYAHFIVVDGRRSSSIGMDAQELADFMINQLGATTGASLDGGGSSAMWVQGRGIVNVPSDGSERATTNGLMMVSVLPAEYSSSHPTGQAITVVGSTNLRLGPGANFASAASVADGQMGTVLDHAMNGVRASGQNWWYVQVGSETGWIGEIAVVTSVSNFHLYR